MEGRLHIRNKRWIFDLSETDPVVELKEDIDDDFEEIDDGFLDGLGHFFVVIKVIKTLINAGGYGFILIACQNRSSRIYKPA